jgi:hypothetical protein
MHPRNRTRILHRRNPNPAHALTIASPHQTINPLLKATANLRYAVAFAFLVVIPGGDLLLSLPVFLFVIPHP